LSSARCGPYCDAEILNIPFEESKYKLYHIHGLNADLYIDADGFGKNDIVKVYLSRGIYWEQDIAELLRKYTKRGSVVVDAGAHIGLHTIAMSRAVGPTGMVHSFEPQRRLCAENWKNLEINSCSGVFLHRKALGDRPRKMQVGLPILGCGDAARTLVEFDAADTRRGDEVDMITLDSLNLENVSVIKADVEFYEYVVFQGAKETIMRCRPVILFEYLGDYENPKDKDDRFPADVEKNAKNSKKLLESYGYTVKQIREAEHISLPTEKMAQLEEEAARK